MVRITEVQPRQAFPVKNTFIHFDELGTDDCQRTLRRHSSVTEVASDLDDLTTMSRCSSVSFSADCSEGSSSVKEEASVRSRSSSTSCSAKESADCTEVGAKSTWAIDGRRLCSNDIRLSTSLCLSIGTSGRIARFVLSILAKPDAKPSGDLRGTRKGKEAKPGSFKAAKGVGTFQLKCTSPVDEEVSVILSVGATDTRSVAHNFAVNSFMSFPGEWNFQEAIQQNADSHLSSVIVTMELRLSNAASEVVRPSQAYLVSPQPRPSLTASVGRVVNNITLRKAFGVSFGCDLQESGTGNMQALIVQQVWEGETVDAWNKQCDKGGPTGNKAFKCGDRILCVNGKSDAEGMRRECEESILLRLSVEQTQDEDLQCQVCLVADNRKADSTVSCSSLRGPQTDGQVISGDAVLSVGSLGHPHLCGRACKYFKKARGCKDGAACSHCHLCAFRAEKKVPAPSQQLARCGAAANIVRVQSSVSANALSCTTASLLAPRSRFCR